MQTGTIEINNDFVTITPAPDGTVWMARYEIARLLDVFVPAVTNNIRAIYKSKILYEEDTMYRYTREDGGFIDFYNLEMIVMLAFRLKSRNADIFRRWVISRLLKRPVMWHLPVPNSSTS